LAIVLEVQKKCDKVSTVSATDTVKLFLLKDALCMLIYFKDRKLHFLIFLFLPLLGRDHVLD